MGIDDIMLRQVSTIRSHAEAQTRQWSCISARRAHSPEHAMPIATQPCIMAFTDSVS
jgi:hypothetical protein